MYRSLLIGGAALAFLAAAVARADEPKKPPATRALSGSVAVHASAAKPGDYWIGVALAPVQEEMSKELKLADGQGFVVQDVVPDGPAAKAGIKPNDILLKVAGKPIMKLEDLSGAIRAAKESKVSIELMREGKRRTISVTPAKQPAKPDEAQWDAVRKWFERARPGQPGQGPMQFRFFHPGAILPPGGLAHPPLPANMSISVTKHADEPAKIVVRRDNEQWECTEKDLDKLPDDIRGLAERMLGPVAMPGMGVGAAGGAGMFNFAPRPMAPQPGIMQPRMHGQLPPSEAIERHIEKRMDEMNRRIEQLRKSIEEMRPPRKSPEKKSPKKKPDKA